MRLKFISVARAARNVFDIERPLWCTGSKGNAQGVSEKGQANPAHGSGRIIQVLSTNQFEIRF